MCVYKRKIDAQLLRDLRITLRGSRQPQRMYPPLTARDT
jgi:hypothetical protein